jgi:hypothetical protein
VPEATRHYFENPPFEEQLGGSDMFLEEASTEGDKLLD